MKPFVWYIVRRARTAPLIYIRIAQEQSFGSACRMVGIPWSDVVDMDAVTIDDARKAYAGTKWPDPFDRVISFSGWY